MAKPAAFRFSADMIKKLKTWAFVTEMSQQAILEEAFQEYAAKRPEIQEKVKKILETIDE